MKTILLTICAVSLFVIAAVQYTTYISSTPATFEQYQQITNAITEYPSDIVAPILTKYQNKTLTMGEAQNFLDSISNAATTTQYQQLSVALKSRPDLLTPVVSEQLQTHSITKNEVTTLLQHAQLSKQQLIDSTTVSPFEMWTYFIGGAILVLSLSIPLFRKILRD